jgi:hypothetical protein
MVLDSSVMNVSILKIVADLNTTVTGVQSAITMYTLVMAAVMLVGAKLGDIPGRDRAFGLGLAVYGRRYSGSRAPRSPTNERLEEARPRRGRRAIPPCPRLVSCLGEPVRVAALRAAAAPFHATPCFRRENSVKSREPHIAHHG